MHWQSPFKHDQWTHGPRDLFTKAELKTSCDCRIRFMQPRQNDLKLMGSLSSRWRLCTRLPIYAISLTTLMQSHVHTRNA